MTLIKILIGVAIVVWLLYEAFHKKNGPDY